MAERYGSEVLASVHETALGMTEAGVMSKRTMPRLGYKRAPKPCSLSSQTKCAAPDGPAGAFPATSWSSNGSARCPGAIRRRGWNACRRWISREAASTGRSGATGGSARRSGRASSPRRRRGSRSRAGRTSPSATGCGGPRSRDPTRRRRSGPPLPPRPTFPIRECRSLLSPCGLRPIPGWCRDRRGARRASRRACRRG